MKEERKKAAALRYRHGVDGAPSVVAAGKGEIAEQIIALARQHHIPLHEDRNLAALLSAMPLHEDIPPQLYRAVAEILAFVYSLSREKRSGSE
jgi:flagellar biosynthesis protein